MKLEFHGAAVDDKRIHAASGKTMTVLNPADGRAFAEVPQCGEDDVDVAVKAAHAAYTDSTRPNVNDRARMLSNLAQLIRDHGETLAQVESQNVGKPINAARGEMEAVANCFQFYAGAVDKVHGQTIPNAKGGHLFTLRQPFGVCGLIVPWNYPLLIAAWKSAPALAMGNTVVIKPAETTPLSALLLADLALEAGFPPGTVNVVPGLGPVAGQALVTHPLVRKVSFTGSVAVGGQVMQSAGPGIKPVSLELGGKSASLIFADADLDACIPSSAWAVFDNTGQDCCARSRVLVEASIFDQFVARFTAFARSLKVGDPAAEGTDLGPMISAVQRDRVRGFIESGLSQNARMIEGGMGQIEGLNPEGYYQKPTIFIDTQPNMRIMREEIFGPVVAIHPFKDEAEALALANDCDYGLSGSIWTRDISRALRLAHQMETGMLSVNSSSSVHIAAPFGGMKKSGIGREQGMAALDHFSQLKSVFVQM